MRPGFIFLVLLLSVNLSAQNRRIDSLLKVLEGHPQEDTVRMDVLNRLSSDLGETGSNMPAIKYAELSIKTGNQLLAKCSDPKEKRFIQLVLSDAYANLGLAYVNMADHADALKSHLTSLKLREEAQDKKGIAAAYMNVGITYKQSGDYDNALKYYLLALDLQRTNKNDKNIPGSLHNIGVIQLMKGDYTRALESFRQSMEMNKKSGNKSWLANNYMGLGYVYDDLGQLDEARKNYNECLKLMEELGSKTGCALSYEDLSSVYLKEKNYGMARKCLEKTLALSLETHSDDITRDAYKGLSQLDSLQGDQKSELKHYKLYIAYNDSVSNEENTKELVRSQMQYDFEKKEDAARAEQEKKEVMAAAEKRKQDIILWSVSAFGLLMLGFAIFAYRSFIQKRNANDEISRQKDIIEEKQKAILDSIHYAKRIQQSLLPQDVYVHKHLSRLKKT